MCGLGGRRFGLVRANAPTRTDALAAVKDPLPSMVSLEIEGLRQARGPEKGRLGAGARR